MRKVILVLLAATTACDSDPSRPDPDPPADVIVNAQVNVQLGNTRAGEQPGYIVTGQVSATQAGIAVAAAIDSVVIRYRIGEGAWVRHSRRTSLPFSDDLPFTAVAGQSYELWAILYARGTGNGATGLGTDEWVAAGMGIP